ncbi:DUF2059 domain-containing protein [Sulfitobacter sabulilitoris]|nr:DUF2059 domain-containing protein [Sulfitobacter sabulilitoris]
MLMLLAAPAWADARVTLLMERLHLAEIVDIMRDEGLDYAQSLDEDMLAGQGGAFWNAQVTRIYDRARMMEMVREGLRNGLSPQQVDRALLFFDSDLGRRIVTLEVAARAAMVDEAVEEAARGTYLRLRNEHDPRLDPIDRFVAANDLLDRNVTGAMTSNMQFYRGIAEGGAIDMTEQEMLADVWEQEQAIRDDTEGWLYGYLLLAYEPLETGDIEEYVAFSQTATGRALNAALFAGFEAMYRDISYALGRAVALSAHSSDL